MHLWLLLSLCAAVRALEQTHGVHPSLLSRYVASGDTWKCLDGSKQIAWKAVNDDYCDCADGSDEPGTGACPNTSFYCKNDGHIGASIPSSRVNDGLCESDCCDGSDELPGVCTNSCKDVGVAYKKKVDAEMKLRKTGSKIRSTYIAYAHKEKKRLEEEVVRLSQEIKLKEKELERAKEVAERTESVSAAALEQKKESPLYASLMTHHYALKSLQREYRRRVEREKALSEILDSLRTGYNPNYQDMAVLAAVRGWEYHAGLPHINDVGKDQAAAAEDISDEELGSDEPVAEMSDEEIDAMLAEEEGMWSEWQLDNELDGLLGTDHVGLLLQHDEHVGTTSEGSLLTDVSSYLPESLAPHFESAVDTLKGFIPSLGAAPPSADTSAATEKARKALIEAENSLKNAVSDKTKAEEDIKELFDPDGFGIEGEWKKLDDTCLAKDTGEYTYEVCLFNEARQKPNKGGQTFSLGKFHSWHPTAQVGTPEYYTKQMYLNGAQCWNGPKRSVKLTLTCGTENVLLTVAEAEKCEYEFTGTSPALCLPPDAGESRKTEL